MFNTFGNKFEIELIETTQVKLLKDEKKIFEIPEEKFIKCNNIENCMVDSIVSN